jgi:hypothetical protein
VFNYRTVHVLLFTQTIHLREGTVVELHKYEVPLKPKYFPEYLVLRDLQFIFFPESKKPLFITMVK